VHNALYAELAHGTVLPGTRAKFRAAITHLVARGAEVIVLACTEFGMVVQAGDSPVPVIDTTIAHAQAAVETALTDEPVQPGCRPAEATGRDLSAH
jgi:aspartate racemase